jgi:uncharacterized protein (DUF1697 family)
MQSLIALLRAVNLAGTGRLAMADLRTVLADLGAERVRTVKQSGNAVFLGDPAEIGHWALRLASALKDRLGLDSVVIMRTGADWDRLVADNPFTQEAVDSPSKLLAMPLADAPPASAVKTLQSAIDGPEQVALAGRELYLSYPAGIGRSKLTARVIERALGTVGTARNWNTVMALHALTAPAMA